MKKYILSLFLIGCTVAAFAQQTWQWGYEAGGAGNDLAQSISTDPDGYSYVTGSFYATATFGSMSVSSNGGSDIFIAKYAPGGTCLWAKHYGSAGNDVGYGIDLDDSGNCYVAGSLSNSIIVAKYDPNGNLVWAVNDSLNNNGTARSISVDSLGNSWITGYLGSGTHIFGTHTISGPGGYVVKYNAGGVAQFATKLCQSGALDLYGVANDAAGNSYLTGYLQNSDVIASQTYTSTGMRDVVLLKVDASGTFSWLRQGSLIIPDNNVMGIGNSVCCDKQGGVCICGKSQGNTIFGNDTFTVSSTMVMPGEIFVVKYDTSGNELWLTQSTTLSNMSSQFDAFSVTSDFHSNIYITGVFSTDINFGTMPLVDSINGMNTYIAMFEPNNGLCQFTIASSGMNPGAFGYGISTDELGATYIAGFDKAPVVFGTYTTQFIGGEDAFVAKIFGGKQSGIHELNADAGVTLFATSGGFQLGISAADVISKEPEIVFYDMSGRVVKTVKVQGAQTFIDHSAFASGIYLWRLKDGAEEMASGKITAF